MRILAVSPSLVSRSYSKWRHAGSLCLVTLGAISLIFGGITLHAAQSERVKLVDSIKDVSLHAIAVRQLTGEHLSDQLEFEISLRMHNFDELVQRTSSGERIESKDLAATYLPTKQEYQSVKTWVESQGLKVSETDSNRLSLFVEGSVAQIQSALGVEFARVTGDEGDVDSATTAPSVPADLANIILGINGLQPHLHPHHLIVRPEAVSSNQPPYKVSELLGAYGASAVTTSGSGETIAILIDTVPANSDLTNFWANNAISQSLSNIQEINVRGVTLPAPSGEETLDTEWTSGIAPAAKIRIYATGDLQFTSLDKGLQSLINDLATLKGIHELSISLGLGESETPASQMRTDSQYFATIASKGVTIFVSSGDGGSSPDGILQPSYYSTDPSVTAAGGTTLRISTSGTTSGETGWTGSGGGKSSYFTRPAWQTGTGVVSGTTRLVPDVASAADPNTGAYIYLNGQAEQVGGTSWSAPSWAGFAALINQARTAAGLSPIGQLNPKIYPLNGTAAFRDITSGSNGAYSCTLGYDLVTGLGTPNVGVLLQDLVGTAATNAPSIEGFSPASGSPGTSVVITGMDLSNVTAVQFNGVSALFTINSASQITVTVPANASTGVITLTTSGNQTASTTGSFTVITPATLQITGFLPTSGTTGTLVTVTGSNFLNVSAVNFGGVNAAFSETSSTQLSATVPASAVTGPITVLSGSASATSTGGFTVVAATSGSSGTLYSTNFSTAQGYSLSLPLAGQNGWLGSGPGANGLVSLNAGGQEAYLGYYLPPQRNPNQTFVWHPVNYTPTTNAPIVKFSTSLAVIDSSNGRYDDFEWAVFNSAGALLFTIDFDNASNKIYYLLNGTNSQYIDTGATFANGTTYQLQVTMNYSQNTWSATLNGNAIVTNQPISLTAQTLNFGDADAVWVYGRPSAPGNNYLLFGNYSVTAGSQ